MNKILKRILITFFIVNNFLVASDSLKIVLVERIAQFIQWPIQNEDFKIGVFQNEQLKLQMQENYSDKTVDKKPIEVINIHNENDKELEKLNVLYLTTEISEKSEKVLRKIQNLPVLVITEYPNDVYNGVHLGFYYENQKIKFMINQETLEQKNLKASYKLLKLAKIVEDKK